ncbi:hypothetical protein Avbf_05571 [Armadillidium vulgare]|nr:hypothetical protein Avbf_05571 [Armadillidium vulgare]
MNCFGAVKNISTSVIPSNKFYEIFLAFKKKIIYRVASFKSLSLYVCFVSFRLSFSIRSTDLPTSPPPKDVCECGDNAECIQDGSRNYCKCLPDFYGNPYDRCEPECVINTREPEHLCNPNPCGPYTECDVKNNKVVCSCLPGYPGTPETSCNPECTTNSECQLSSACINRLCVDPCAGACHPTAECRVVSHHPRCTCPEGYTGNPSAGCYIQPEVERDPCKACGQNAECIEDDDKVICKCPPNYYGSPYVACKPECIINQDCPNYLSCQNENCKDPCPGACGINALCDVVTHRPICSCPHGYEGDAYIECREREPEISKRPILDETTKTYHPSITPSDKEPIGCENNSDCPYDKSCVNKLCISVCHESYCGENADCKTIGNRPLCLCPYGTTGNPTIKCIAFETVEKHTHRPIVSIEKITNEPIIPVTKTSTYFSILIEDQTQKPMIDFTRPPPPPVIPPIQIACINNDDCSTDNSCVNNLCYDACAFGTCSDDANCFINNHRPICVCPPGYKGNPTEGCKTPIIDYITTLSPLKETTLSVPHDQIKPIYGPSEQTEIPLYETKYPSREPSFTTLKYPKPPPPISVGCISNDDCSTTNTCINKICLDICWPGLCGENAECQTKYHRPKCLCPPGTTGNPNIKCSALHSTEPIVPLKPVADQTHIEDKPIKPLAQSPKPILPPVGTSVESESEEVIFEPPPPPILPSVIVSCASNDDCDSSHSCVNKLCYEACSLGICGENSECVIKSHRPVCICPPGMTGDPQSGCYKIDIEKLSTVKPDIEIVPHDPVQIEPISAESAEVLPPVEIHPTTARPEKIPSRPPKVPTPPPIKILCARNDECPYDASCVNKLCMDVCFEGFCGEEAECKTINHRPLCVCPHGTTGNPTIKCQSIDVASPSTYKPIAETTVHDEKPIYPGKIEPTSIKPDVFTTSTTPEPIIIRPVPLPVIPIITISCESNDECSMDNSCINNVCYDACSFGTCSEDAECKVSNHRPVCICPSGSDGNPLSGCQKPISDYESRPPPEADSKESHEIDSLPPIAGPSYSSIPPIAGSTTKRPFDEPVTPIVVPPLPPLNPIGCESNDGCSQKNTCINKVCMDICWPGLCGENAECQTEYHRPKCLCPPGTTGNPNIKCSALHSKEPIVPLKPVADQTHIKDKPINH